MEQSANTKTYTKEDKEQIFEIVNSIHLNLKGNTKKLTKRKFVHTWKSDNKGLGCFDLFIKLYESEGIFDSMNEAFAKYVEDDYLSPEDYRTKKKLPYAKYRRFMAWKDEEVEELEKEVEKIKQGNGYISITEHDEEVKELKDKYNYLKDEYEDTRIKLENKYELMNEKHIGVIKRLEAQVNYFKSFNDSLLSKSSED